MESNSTLSGFITTDGTTGLFSTSTALGGIITDYEITATNLGGPTFTFDDTNSDFGVSFPGTIDIRVTDTAIVIEAFAAPTGGSLTQFLFTTASNGVGFTFVGSNPVLLVDSGNSGSNQVEVSTISTPYVFAGELAAVPLPAGLPLLLAGLAGLTLVRRNRGS